MKGVVRGHFRGHDGGGHRVLVPDGGAEGIADGLLKGEDDVLFPVLVMLHPLRQELEAGEGILHPGPVMLRHGPGHLRGDDALEGQGPGGQGPGLPLRQEEVVQEQDPRLVAGEEPVFPGGGLHHEAQAVGIRVGADDEVRVLPLRQDQGPLEPHLEFRVGVRAGGEIPVGGHLLPNAAELLQPQPPQGLRHQGRPGPVEGRVDHLQVRLRHGLGPDALLEDGGQKRLVRLPADQFDAPVRQLRHGQGGQHVDLLHGRRHLGSVLRGQLGSVGPIDLVAVVFLGVVAGGDVDPRRRPVMPDGEGELRGGPQGFEQPYMDPHGRQDARRVLGIFPAVVAAVVADYGPGCGGLAPLGQDQAAQGPGRLAHHPGVHAPDACAHHAPQPGGAEAEGGEESLPDLLIVSPDGLQFLPFLRRQGVGGQPAGVFLPIVHSPSSSSSTGFSSSRARSAMVSGTITSMPEPAKPKMSFARVPSAVKVPTTGTPKLWSWVMTIW